jgi:hypothetical protein
MAKDEEADLFDYFDPLLSPHAYPNGVSPDNRPIEDEIPNEKREKPLVVRRTGAEVQRKAKDDEEPDLFDYFDPLLSPHAYPNGISPDKKPIEDKIPNEEREKPVVMRSAMSDVCASNVFDPTLSPHAYPKGTPSAIVGDKDAVVNSVPRVGILLVDHGSRNMASNERLQQLARSYQRTVESHVIVKACHMEIANPTIPEGLEALLKEGVEEIVCHPYFLSPDGRHVSEDIPEIVKGAIESLNIEIPVITTEPVGANMDRMVGIIQSIVEENSQLLGKKA